MAARWRGGQEYTGWRERARGPSDGEYLAMQCQGARECQGERHVPGAVAKASAVEVGVGHVVTQRRDSPHGSWGIVEGPEICWERNPDSTFIQ